MRPRTMRSCLARLYGRTPAPSSSLASLEVFSAAAGFSPQQPRQRSQLLADSAVTAAAVAAARSAAGSAATACPGDAGAGNGVNIVSPGDIDINGNIEIHGLIFSNSANFNDLGTGTADIYGAIVTCAAQRSNGNGTISYDSNALGGPGLRPGVMARVPGSWRDFTP